MKKIFTIVAAALMSLSLSAEVKLVENFNYPEGDLEQATAGTEVELNKWIVCRKAADANGESPRVVDKQLTYAGYVGSAQGKTAVLSVEVGATSATQRISSYYLDTASVDTFTTYAAMIVNPIQAQNTSGRDFLVWEGSKTSSMTRGRILMRKSSTTNCVELGVSKNNSSSTGGWSAPLPLNTPFLLVMKYEAIPGGDKNDVVKIFINPDLSSSESANACLTSGTQTAETTVTDMTVRAIGLRQRGTGVEIGGLRWADTWEEVLGQAADVLTVSATSVKNNAYVAPATTELSVTFSENVTLANGGATLNGAALTGSIQGATVTFPVELTAEEDYTLLIPAGAYAAGTKNSPKVEINFNTKNPNIYVVENFNYTAGSELEGQGAWVVSTQTANQGGKSPLVADTTLSYPGYGASAQGLVMALDSVEQEISGDANRTTVLPFSASNLAVGDTVYTAMLVNFANNPSTTGRQFFGYIKQGASDGANTTVRGIVSARIQKDTVEFGIAKKDGEVVWSNQLQKSETALLVVRYINGSASSSGDNDEFALYVNPDPSKTEAENAALLQDASDNNVGGGANLLGISFRQMKTMALIGGIRVAKTWADALDYTPVEPMAVETVEQDMRATKVLRDGKIYIERGAQVYTLTGMRVK